MEFIRYNSNFVLVNIAEHITMLIPNYWQEFMRETKMSTVR